MSKHYRPWKIDEAHLLPPSVQDYVPERHLSRFIVALVRESLDLSEIEARNASVFGQPPFHPALMTALLLHGYANGIYSSRRIAKACIERTDFMMIVAGDPPDFRTISEFRRRHLTSLAALFVQVLKLAETAGLAKLGHVALDGTKIKANASKHKAMSYERMKKREAELQAEVDRWLAAAETADAEEDRQHGTRRGDELPEWIADKQRRLVRIREAKAVLEAQAKAAAEEEERRRRAEEKRKAEGRKEEWADARAAERGARRQGATQLHRSGKPHSEEQGRLHPGIQPQAAVDGEAQIIVAHALTQSTSDQDQLTVLIDGIEANLGAKPKEASADAGYCSEANLQALADRNIAGYIATGRAKHAADDKRGTGGPLTQAMRQKLKRAGWRSRYRLRKQIVEPVFGQIKQARGFRQFLLRGVEKVRAEWALICTAHNLTKLARAA